MIDILPTFAFGYIADSDITITGLSENEMIFEYHEQLNLNTYTLHLTLFHPQLYDYHHFYANLTIIKIQKRTFDCLYTAHIEVYNKNQYLQILKTYQIINERKNSDHALQKINSFDGIFKNSYPYEKDRDFHINYKSQMADWFYEDCSSIDFNQNFKHLMGEKELAFTISKKIDYQKLLDNGIEKLMKDKFSEFHLNTHPIANLKFTRIYIGNEFCPNMLPDKDSLNRMIDMLWAENYHITICYPYLQESRLSQADSLLTLLHNKSMNNKKIEVTINDWGLLNYIKEKNFSIECILGRLLNKRKKDPRYSYWMGYKHNDPKSKCNNLNNDIFHKYLGSLGITRFEFEDYDQAIEIPLGKHSLHFPYYQINTSTFCNLYADVKGKSQNNIKDCAFYCQYIYYHYPKHVNLIGIGNSIFGFNKNSVLYKLDKLKYYTENQIDRFILTL